MDAGSVVVCVVYRSPGESKAVFLFFFFFEDLLYFLGSSAKSFFYG